MSATVLLVGPESSSQRTIAKRLRSCDRQIRVVGDTTAALVALQASPFDMIVICSAQQEMHPVVFAIEAKDLRPHTPIVLLASRFGPDPQLPFIDVTIQTTVQMDDLEPVVDAILRDHHLHFGTHPNTF